MVYFIYNSKVMVCHWGKSEPELKKGRNLEAGADCQGHRSAAYRLAPCGLLSLSFYITKDHQPRNSTAYVS